MNRIVSKIDYDMQMLAKISPEKAKESWDKIKERSFIINQAIEVVKNDKENKNIFFAPTICHYILSNPQDIDKETYKWLVIKVLKDTDLNRLVVLNNTSFLDLIKSYIRTDLDEYFNDYLNRELSNRKVEDTNVLNYVEYEEVEENAEKLMTYKDNSFDVELGKNEIDTFSKLSHISIVNEEEHLNKLNDKENASIIILDNETINHKPAFERNAAAKLTRKKSQERR